MYNVVSIARAVWEVNAVAARHFAKGVDNNAREDDETEPNDLVAYSGRHLKQVSLQEFEPPSAASTFVVSVPQNDEADVRARSRIDEILRELEEEMAQPVPEPEPEPEPVTEPEPKPEPVPETKPEPEPMPVLESEPEPDPESEPEQERHFVFWRKAEPEAEPALEAGPKPERGESMSAVLDQIIVDDDLLDEILLSEGPHHTEHRTDSLDSTAKLPVRGIMQASEDAYNYGRGTSNTRKPEPATLAQGKEGNRGPEEYVASADRRERLQVSADASSSKEIQKSTTTTSITLTIFHMDD